MHIQDGIGIVVWFRQHAGSVVEYGVVHCSAPLLDLWQALFSGSWRNYLFGQLLVQPARRGRAWGLPAVCFPDECLEEGSTRRHDVNRPPRDADEPATREA
jgi:hypothetical protein